MITRPGHAHVLVSVVNRAGHPVLRCTSCGEQFGVA